MLTDFQNSFTDRYASKYKTKSSLRHLERVATLLLKHKYRETSKNLKHAPLSTINRKAM